MADPSISPHKFGTSFTSFTCKPVNSEDVRSALKVELSGRVVVDSEQVMRRLRVENVPETFVTDLLRDFGQRQSLAISSLQELVAGAEGAGSRKSDEKAMYPHLQSILDDITDFGSESATRCFNNTHKVKVKGEVHIIKPKSTQGLVPRSADLEKVARTLAQTADYARLHLSSRPFQLFSIAVVVSGSKFVVAIFDRDGVTVSSDFDMWQDIEVFVRVIRQITHGLSPIELGQDPSVQELPAESPLLNKVHTKQLELCTPPATVSFPSYLVTCPRQLSPRPATPFDATEEQWTSDQWVTIGPPIWTSLSLCGRSTSVWRVTRVEDGKIVNINEIRILKNSWRRSNRDSESAIYQSIKTHPSGVAKFLQGGGRHGPWYHGFLNTTGRALWEGDSFLDIVKGGTKTYAIKIYYIVTLALAMYCCQPSKPGKEGFLTDLDFARIQTIVKHDIQEHLLTDGSVVRSKHTRWGDAKRGVEMTGTVQFMAISLVNGLVSNIVVEHVVHHDVESFIWVLAYAAARLVFNNSHLSDVTQTKQAVSLFFASAWGPASLTAILNAKRSLQALLPPTQITHLFPDPLLHLLHTLHDFFHDQLKVFASRPPLTHDELLVELDKDSNVAANYRVAFPIKAPERTSSRSALLRDIHSPSSTAATGQPSRLRATVPKLASTSRSSGSADDIRTTSRNSSRPRHATTYAQSATLPASTSAGGNSASNSDDLQFNLIFPSLIKSVAQKLNAGDSSSTSSESTRVIARLPSRSSSASRMPGVAALRPRAPLRRQNSCSMDVDTDAGAEVGGDTEESDGGADKPSHVYAHIVKRSAVLSFCIFVPAINEVDVHNFNDLILYDHFHEL
ncbi:hypothetical protein ONZ45_g15400 [Pleurotus djamor]|nr:hypothetical protein ONZ45_g15400 [Pleurotus djamor]